MNQKNEFETGFLYSTSNYLTGAATILNLSGCFYEYNSSETEAEADYKAIRNDFNVVGQDLAKIFTKTIK